MIISYASPVLRRLAQYWSARTSSAPLKSLTHWRFINMIVTSENALIINFELVFGLFT